MYQQAVADRAQRSIRQKLKRKHLHRIRHCYMAGEMESRILHSRQVQAVEYGGSVAGPGQGNRRNSAVGYKIK